LAFVTPLPLVPVSRQQNSGPFAVSGLNRPALVSDVVLPVSAALVAGGVCVVSVVDTAPVSGPASTSV
jgi:hypothetical protein